MSSFLPYNSFRMGILTAYPVVLSIFESARKHQKLSMISSAGKHNLSISNLSNPFLLISKSHLISLMIRGRPVSISGPLVWNASREKGRTKRWPDYFRRVVFCSPIPLATSRCIIHKYWHCLCFAVKIRTCICYVYTIFYFIHLTVSSRRLER